MQAISDGGVSQPYVVAVKSFGNTRIHSGLIRIDGKSRWMLGLDRALGNHAILQVDYTSGEENSLTYGVAINLTDNLALTAARSTGNSAEVEDGHVINLAWSVGWN